MGTGEKMNLSFAGCGFLGIYHVGVAVCFRKYAPHLLLNNISGASAGALAACGLLCDLPIGDFTSDVLRVATEARSRSLGPFHPSFNVQKLLLDGLNKFLPEDAHLRVNGKLHISLTRVYDGKNVIVSHFDSKEDLIAALNASCFIPLFSGLLPPKFQGVRYMDGGLSDNLPTLDENTITVSPFCGESDICPRDDSMQLFHINVANTSIELSKHNVYRFMRILFPPKPEVLSNICKQGFDDALRFLHRNNLINCTRCLAVHSTFVIQKTAEESIEYDPQCHECKVHRQEALVSNLPDTVLTIFQEAIDSANKGLINWIFRHRGMKLLSVLSLPYSLPADVMYATFTKSNVSSSFATGSRYIINTLTSYNNVVSVVGDTIERRNFQYKVVGNAFLTTTKDASHEHMLLCNNERFMATTPSMGNKLWDLSKYFLDQLSGVLNKVNSKRQQISAKISCQLALTEYRDETKSPPFTYEDAETTNKMNLNFTLNLDGNDERSFDETATDEVIANKIMSRRSSLKINTAGDISVGDDTFENILQATSHHEALMTYYYLDENNKVKVTEIFDVTDSDSPAVQSTKERELNQQLQFDDDWDESTWSSSGQESYQCLRLEDRSKSLAEISEYSIDDLHEREYANLFSDPESEWAGSLRVDEPEDDENPLFSGPDLRPESDQPTTSLRAALTSPYQIPSFTYNDYDI